MNIAKRNLLLKLIGMMFLVSFFIVFIEKKFIKIAFMPDRFIVLFLIFFFLSLHFILNIKKMYEFIYKKRYLIAFLILVFCVFNKYHMSSIGMYNTYIQPNIQIENARPFLGIPRAIRSDEWLTSTPTMLSQASDNVNFAKENSVLMAKNNNVLLFPRLPAKHLSILGSPFAVGFLFLDVERAFSLLWMGKLIVLFLFSFEFCMIITRKRKLYSLLGAFLISFAPAYHWWSSIEFIIYGQVAIVLINLFIKEKIKYKRIIFSILLGIVISAYALLIYPAWLVPFGYCYCVLALYLLYNNRSNLKLIDSVYLLIPLFICAILVIPPIIESREIIKITQQTVYPGERFWLGGEGWEFLFLYFSMVFYPFFNVVNPSELSQFLSLFPIPLLMGLFYIIKNYKSKKQDYLLIFLTFFTIVLFSWNVFPFPRIISKITLLYTSFGRREQLVVGYATILILLRILSCYETKCKITKLEVITNALIALFISVFGINVARNITDSFANNYLVGMKQTVSFYLFSGLIFLILLNRKRTNKYIAIGLISISILIGATINPISRGLSVIYEKPFAIKVQEILKTDANAIWLSLDSIVLQNYLIANGAKTINSVNFYPNISLWKMLDKKSEYEKVYNRFAHVSVSLTNAPNKFELVQADFFNLYLNCNELINLNINYLVSNNSDLKVENQQFNLARIYSEDNVSIYKVTANKAAL